MSPLSQQKFNTYVGGLMLGVGVLAWLGAIAYAVFPNDEAPAPVHLTPVVRLDSCATALRQLGYTVDIEGEDIKAFEPYGTDLQRQLEKASIGTTVCKLPLQAFCLGNQTCEKPGLNFTLRRPAPQRERVGETAPAKASPAQAMPTTAKKK